MNKFYPFAVLLKAFAFILVLASCSERESSLSPQSNDCETVSEDQPEVLLEEKIDLEEILRAARWTSSKRDFHGYVIKNDEKLPISLFSRAGNIQVFYQDKEEVEHRYHLRMKGNEVVLYQLVDGKILPLEGQRLAQPIQESDLLLEDIALLDLRGEDVTLVGEDRVSGQSCYKIRIIHSGDERRYRISYAWVSKKWNLLLKVIGYSKDGKPLKQIQTTDASMVDGKSIAQKFRVDSFTPGANRVSGVTYLDFRRKKR